jgi:putative salt-induced outer membrane protein
MRRNIFLILLLSSLPIAAQAAPVPAPVAEMIRAAMESGDVAAAAAVVKVARKANPKSAAEITALYTRLKYRAEFRQRYKLKRQRPLQGWKGKGEFGAFDTSGQVNSTGITAGLVLVRDGLRWNQSFSAALDYLHHNGVEERDRYFAGHQANYKINDRIYALGLASWEGNRAQGFNSRFIASVGAGVSVVHSPRMSLSVEASPAVRETSYLSSGSDSALAARVAGNYHWDMTSRLTLTEAATYYKESRDETLTSEAALTMKLIGALSTRFSYRLQKENQSLPLPTAINSTDTTSRLSLVYTF